MPVIEFSQKGIILSANKLFLDAMSYTIDEIRGKHHKMFVDEKLAKYPEYKIFWQNMSSGVSSNRTFSRQDSNGNTVVMTAIYHPIMAANGKVVKVTKLISQIVKAVDSAISN